MDLSQLTDIDLAKLQEEQFKEFLRIQQNLTLISQEVSARVAKKVNAKQAGAA